MTQTYELKEPVIIDTDDYSPKEIEIIKKVLLPKSERTKNITVIKIPKGTKIEYI